MKDPKKSGRPKEIIHLHNVARFYHMGGSLVKAVEGMNIVIKEGDFVAIMGPSGSGKSTSMNLVGNLDMPTHGKIYLDNKDTSQFSESDLAQLRGKKIGFIFQQFNLIPNLTALENVMLPMMFQHVEESERRQKAKEILGMVKLEGRINHYPGQLSGGEQQRVAIARALANDPEIILADEPTGNLDSKTGEIVMKFLNELNERGKTIVVVTHDKNLAIRHAKEIYWIRDGKVEKITRKVGDEWRKLPSAHSYIQD
jgi:putative ABC transport system ATP-binding protein